MDRGRRTSHAVTLPGRLDGGTGAALLAEGIAPARAAMEHPAVLRAMHRSHVEAGADALTTATFGIGELDDVEAVARAATECAREAGPNGYILGSVGPIGDIGRAAAALRAAGVDAIALETFSDASELLAWTTRLAVGGPVFAFWCPTKGVDIGVLAERLEGEGATAIGCSCGDGIRSVEASAIQMRAAAKGPLYARPSAGVPMAGEHPILAAALAKSAKRLRAHGIHVGGCCGVDAPRLRAMHAT